MHKITRSYSENGGAERTSWQQEEIPTSG